MCGIVGILCFEGLRADRNKVAEMAKAMKHRGPDGEGFLFDDGAALEWTDWKGEIHVLSGFDRREGERDCQLALGHCRLSVIDLSERGHQPMNRMKTDPSGLFIMVKSTITLKFERN